MGDQNHRGKMSRCLGVYASFWTGLGYYRDVPPEWFADETAMTWKRQPPSGSWRWVQEIDPRNLEPKIMGKWSAPWCRRSFQDDKRLARGWNTPKQNHYLQCNMLKIQDILYVTRRMSPGCCQEKAEEVEQQHIYGGQIGHMILQDPPHQQGWMLSPKSKTICCRWKYDASFRECQNFSLLWEKKREPLKVFFAKRVSLSRFLRPFFASVSHLACFGKVQCRTKPGWDQQNLGSFPVVVCLDKEHIFSKHLHPWLHV